METGLTGERSCRAWISPLAVLRSRCSVDEDAWTRLTREERDIEAVHERTGRPPPLVLRLLGDLLALLFSPHPFTVDAILDLHPTLLLLLKARSLRRPRH